MWKITGLIVKRFWGLCAFLLISLAVLVSLGRELAPQVANYQAELESYLSEASGADVSIDAIQAHWKGLSPQLALRGIEVHGEDGELMFSVKSASARVSLLQSLLNRQLVFRDLRFVQLDMAFLQNPDGSWLLRGMKPRTDSASSINLKDPLDIFLVANRIEVLNARFAFDFRTGHHTEIELPSATLENRGDFHRLRSELAVDSKEDVVSLIIEAQGDPRVTDTFRAEGHLSLRNFDLDRVMAALPGEWWQGLPEQEWREDRQLNLDLWLSITPGMAMQSHGFLDIGEVPVDWERGIQVPLRTSTKFAGQLASSGAWKLALRDLSLLVEGVDLPSLNVQLSSDDLGEPVKVQVEEVDLEPWMTALGGSGILNGWVLDTLYELNPRGQLRNTLFTLSGTGLDDIVIRANLKDVFIDSWRGAPAVEFLNGYIETKPLSGFVDIASEHGFSMHYPTIYEQPLTFDRARGRVHWQVDLERQTVDVHSGLLAVDGPAGEGRGYFSLHMPMEPNGNEELILQVGLRNSETHYHKQFVPSVLPEPLLEWLDQSIGDGQLHSGGFLFRGGLLDDSAAEAAIQLYLNVEDGELAYHPDWPVLQNTTGVIWLDNLTVLADIDSARIFDTQVEEGHIRVQVNPHGLSPVLDIKAKARGQATDGLRFLRETPLQTVVGGDWLEAWELDGELHSAVALTVSLDDQQTPEIHQIDLDFQNAVASNDALNLAFDSIQGRLSFNDSQGLHAENITGQLWDRAISANLAEVQGDYRALTLTLRGQADVRSVREWTQRPELAFITGEAAFVADLFVPYAQDVGVLPRLTIRSELEGVDVDLPAPFGKSATEPQTLVVGVTLEAEQNLLEFRYSDLAHAIFSLEDGDMTRAAVGLGSNARLPETGKLHVSGSLSQFDLTEWNQVWARYQEAHGELTAGDGGTPPIATQPIFDLRFDTFAYEGFKVDDLQIQGEELSDRWQLTLDSNTVGGEVYLYSDSTKPVLLNLSHLYLPGTGADAESTESVGPAVVSEDLLATVDPRLLPPLDVNLDEFRIGGEDFGSWSFQLRPTETGAIAENISGTVRGGRILGMAEDVGAKLEWGFLQGALQATAPGSGQGKTSSRFQGRFVTDNLGGVLEQWGQPRLLDSESSQFVVDLQWPGSPAAMAITSLQGDIAMAVRRGSFVRGAGDAGTAGGALLELIAFFNFDTWLRRIRLDFSDLKRTGMAFESIKGALHFDGGVVVMDDPIIVDSYSSRFQMAGMVNLMDSTLDTRLVATIPVGGNLTFVAALAGLGLPTVAGMWLISKVFEEQFDKMSSLSFNVSGSLDDPKMKFVRFFDHEAVHEASRAQLEHQ